tara:strand:+ start:56 stop:808 length:753 start_codon:yes stop_codon:yes gene_type:complete
MLKKRIIGNVIVKNNFVVQSFNYKNYLPIGKPEFVIENLDNWGVDEIAIVVIDRDDQGPDYDLLDKINNYKIKTPLIYGGGIKNKDQANKVINYGVERIMLDSIVYESPDNIMGIYSLLGSQALILSLPIIREENQVYFYNYKTRKNFSINKIKNILSEDFFSELVLIDVQGEGGNLGFDKYLSNYLKTITDIPFILFGGIANSKHVKDCLIDDKISAVMIGNSLNYKEHRIYHLKKDIKDLWLRKHILK